MNQLDSQKSRIKELAEAGENDEAISLCNELIERIPASRPEILRLRAYIHARRGMYAEAIADRESLINDGEGILRDYYQLGDNSLSAGRFADASKWLKEVLRRGAEQNETWFDSAAWFLLSFAQMRLGRIEDAEASLEKAAAIDPGCALPIRGEGVVTYQSLRDEIRRTKSKPSES